MFPLVLSAATSCPFLIRKTHAVKQCHVMTSEQLLLALYYQKLLNIVFLGSSDQYLQLKTISSVLRKTWVVVMLYTRFVMLLTDTLINGGNIVNLCAIVNHYALYIKLMKRNIPVQLLEVLENLISCCHSYVKWNNVWSCVLEINFGVRQGSVLSPF